MYDQEVRNSILNLLKEKSIKEVSERFNISCSTLYRWQKIKSDSKLIRSLISEERYDEAFVIIKNYPNNEIIQSQLMTIYIKQEAYDEAMAIAKKFPNASSIQSQLMAIYMKQKAYEDAIAIAKTYPDTP